MRWNLVATISLLAAAASCKSERTNGGGSAAALPPAAKGDAAAAPPVAASSDGLPSSVPLAPGGTLVSGAAKGDGGTWTYAYSALEPEALVQQQKAALVAAGWTVVVRTEVVVGKPAPVRSVFGSRDGKLVIGQAYRGASGAEQRVIVQGIQGILTVPPAGYPAEFPFLTFGILAAPDPSSKHISLVYNGELEGIRGELTAATAAAGWDCLGARFELLSMCTKAGAEVYLKLDSLSANRQSLFVSLP